VAVDTGQGVVSVVTYGAKGDGTTNDTAAIQTAIDYAKTTGAQVFIPSGVYRVSQLLLREGTILQGVTSGSYPDNNAIPGASVLARIANTNKDLLLAPDGANYCRLFDLAIDGNKNNNTAGYGLRVADGAVDQEGQFIIQRCYFHDNPNSNLYLGKNRRANSVTGSIFNYSLHGDGITVAGSDNTISSNILGSNARAGLCLGTTATQNWAAAPQSNAVTIAHVNNNDIYGNLVGIAVANASSGCMITGNGIDRNTYQGVTIYSGASNALVTNVFHSNGTSKDNTYAHIDVGAAVSEVCISNNCFGPLDGGISNIASHCLHVAPGGTKVVGHIGAVDPTSAHAVTNLQADADPWSLVSNVGAVITGSGNDILSLRNSGSSTVTRITDAGTFVHSGDAQFTQPVNHVLGGSAPITADRYLLSLVNGKATTSQIATKNYYGQTAPIAAWLGLDGSTLLGGVDAEGGVLVHGVPGATAGARFAGGTTSGAPASGSWKAGDFVVDHTGKLWVHSGSAWLAAGGSGGAGEAVDNSSPPLEDEIVATPGKAAAASPADHQHPRTSWAAADHGLVTWTMDVLTATANSVLPAAGTLYVVRVHVPAAARVTNIVAAITNAGAGLLAGKCFAGLWHASSKELVGATADQSANWDSAGPKTMPLSGAVELTAGDYYIGIYASGSTLPSFARGNNQIGGGFANVGLSANFRVASANTGLNSNPPAILGTLTAASTAWWLALS
jgi:parallel beta-helix repeat protein